MFKEFMTKKFYTYIEEDDKILYLFIGHLFHVIIFDLFMFYFF